MESDGSLDIHLLEKSIRPDTAIVSVMWANNETGVIFPLEEIAAICRSKGVLCHTDAVQMPGKLKINVAELGVDFLSLSAHKLHAPKGIGLLYVKRRTQYQPYVIGGGQEHGRRGGTENVAEHRGVRPRGGTGDGGIDGRKHARPRACATGWRRPFSARFPTRSRNGNRESRLPNTSNIAFDFVEAESILLLLDQAGICASSGSACTTGSLDPSHVLTAMGLIRRARAGPSASAWEFTTRTRKWIICWNNCRRSLPNCARSRRRRRTRARATMASIPKTRNSRRAIRLNRSSCRNEALEKQREEKERDEYQRERLGNVRDGEQIHQTMPASNPETVRPMFRSDA